MPKLLNVNTGNFEQIFVPYLITEFERLSNIKVLFKKSGVQKLKEVYLTLVGKGLKQYFPMSNFLTHLRIHF